MAAKTNPVTMFKDDEHNARSIADENLAALGVAMEEFGDLSGIVWNERSGLLVCGNQRMSQLREVGVTEWTRLNDVAGVIVHPKTGERFTIRIVTWDDAKSRMANIVANSPELQGEFTDELQDQLKDLEEQARFEELRLTELLEAEVSGTRERRGLDDFDMMPAAKKAWILIATTDEMAAEIEADLRNKWEGEQTRVEVSYGIK